MLLSTNNPKSVDMYTHQDNNINQYISGYNFTKL